MKKDKIIIFLPALASLACMIITLIIYFTVLKGNEAIRILQIVVSPLVALVIPVVNKIFKTNIPFAVNVVVTIHSILALDLASGLNFYARWPLFDKFLHTYFGFYGTLIVFVIMLYFNGEKMNKAGFFIMIFLAVLGISVLWEIYEYTCDVLMGMDCQRWSPSQEMIEGGLTYEQYIEYVGNPLNDTMWDQIVTVIGSLLFFLVVFIDKHFGYKMCGSIYRQVKGKKAEGEAVAAGGSVGVKAENSVDGEK